MNQEAPQPVCPLDNLGLIFLPIELETESFFWHLPIATVIQFPPKKLNNKNKMLKIVILLKLIKHFI